MSNETLDYISSLDTKNKNDKYLILNSPSWIKTKDATLKHLKQRTEVFWSEIEKISNKNLSIPEVKSVSEEKNKFIFVIPFYNCSAWIQKCIKSVKRQKYKNFKCFLIDDMSTDGSSDVVKKIIQNDSRFKLIMNKEKKYALGNIAYILNEKDIKKDDVIILMDGDDWLSSAGVLSRLNDEYVKDVFMTYGSYVYSPIGRKGSEPSKYPDDIIKNNLFRRDSWRASHLRTFKYHLWKKLNQEDLKENAQYFEMTYDQAIMLPLLEMSSERSRYIPEVLYVYNKQNPLNVDKIKAKKQSDLAEKIRNKKPYQRV